MPKRRKRRVRVRWPRVLGLLLAANVAAGLAFSPVTSATNVRAVGVQEEDEARVVRVLQRLRDVPCLRADTAAVESLIMANPAIRSAKLTQNIFRQAVLEVQYVRPAASIAGKPGFALGTDGTLFRTRQPLDGLVAIRLPHEAGSPVLAFCSGWECQTLAALAQRVNRDKALRNVEIEVYSNGLVCLNNRQGARVILGPTERLDEKLDRLQELIAQQPDLLLRAKEINLVSPTKPAARFRDPDDTP